MSNCVDWGLIRYLRNATICKVLLIKYKIPSGSYAEIYLYDESDDENEDLSGYRGSYDQFFSVIDKGLLLGNGAELTKNWFELLEYIKKDDKDFVNNTFHFSFKNNINLERCIKPKIRYLMKEIGADFNSLAEINSPIIDLFNNRKLDSGELNFYTIKNIVFSLNEIKKFLVENEGNKELYRFYFKDIDDDAN